MIRSINSFFNIIKIAWPAILSLDNSLFKNNPALYWASAPWKLHVEKYIRLI